MWWMFEFLCFDNCAIASSVELKQIIQLFFRKSDRNKGWKYWKDSFETRRGMGNGGKTEWGTGNAEWAAITGGREIKQLISKGPLMFRNMFDLVISSCCLPFPVITKMAPRFLTRVPPTEQTLQLETWGMGVVFPFSHCCLFEQKSSSRRGHALFLVCSPVPWLLRVGANTIHD